MTTGRYQFLLLRDCDICGATDIAKADYERHHLNDKGITPAEREAVRFSRNADAAKTIALSCPQNPTARRFI